MNARDHMLKKKIELIEDVSYVILLQIGFTISCVFRVYLYSMTNPFSVIVNMNTKVVFSGK